ncbi:MAG TPA: hypothetical protein VGI26_00180 [Solirubrobacteraceae bacterium]|jgi:hypothetical protein
MQHFECVEPPEPQQQRLADLEAQLADMDELYRRYDEVSLELAKTSAALSAELDQARREVAHMRAVMEATWASLSWRVTEPLRRFKSLRRQ